MGWEQAPVATEPRRVIVWDLVLTIVLIVVLIGVTAVLWVLSFFLAFAGDSCGAVECDYDVIGTGFVVAMFGPIIAAVPPIVAAVIVLVFKRIAFWIPLVGIALVIAVFVVGVLITVSGVPGATL
ncbi:hypothetical protein ACDF64_03660 [Agromyces sp. MMS24-JH15]|uniref:hypothetical protein n=1 Tax=Agromyces sp. MMS24-JH15 TaxID=3243765 RepID=UPI0037479ADC